LKHVSYSTIYFLSLQMSAAGLHYGTRLRWLAIEVNLTMNVFSVGYTEGLPVYDQWEAFVADIVSTHRSALPSSIVNHLVIPYVIFSYLL